MSYSKDDMQIEKIGEDNFFFFNDTATTEIYTLSLHDALPICRLLLLIPALSFYSFSLKRKLSPPRLQMTVARPG